MYHPKLEELVRRDPRYPIEAYEFVREAILSAGRAGGEADLSAAQLLHALPALAKREFGLLAPTVFHLWNVNQAEDIGRIVANLISVGLMSAGPGEGKEDFRDGFDLAAALGGDYRIDWPPERLDA